jgi:hypothetical protein
MFNSSLITPDVFLTFDHHNGNDQVVNLAKRRRDHVSYLLRLWRTGSEENAVCRALLENPYTGERRGFAGLKDLFVYLQAQIDAGGHQSLKEDEESTQ